jgi:ferric-dicitrate binding protein FerR (iron transport regulator)
MEERIKHLFRKFLANDCTKEEFDEVFLYLQNEENDPLMREALRRAYEQGPAQGRRRIRGKRGALSLALVLVLLVAGGIVWRLASGDRGGMGLAKAGAGRLVTKATHRSEYKYLLLPDSTEVWLNAASTLEFPESFGKGQRKVVLTGEAFFDVKRAEQMPFIIYTGDVSTEVLGTAFNIKAYPNMEKIIVSVKQGKVKVNYAEREAALLTKGQQVSIGVRDNSMKQKKMAGGEMASWQDGELVYDDYAIGDIIADLERVYDVEIKVQSPAAGSLRVSTAFKRQNGVKKALEVLSELADAELIQDGGKYILK